MGNSDELQTFREILHQIEVRLEALKEGSDSTWRGRFLKLRDWSNQQQGGSPKTSPDELAEKSASARSLLEELDSRSDREDSTLMWDGTETAVDWRRNQPPPDVLPSSPSNRSPAPSRPAASEADSGTGIEEVAPDLEQARQVVDQIVEDFLQEARGHLERGDTGAAQNAIDRILKLAPDHPEAAGLKKSLVPSLSGSTPRAGKGDAAAVRRLPGGRMGVAAALSAICLVLVVTLLWLRPGGSAGPFQVNHEEIVRRRLDRVLAQRLYEEPSRLPLIRADIRQLAALEPNDQVQTRYLKPLLEYYTDKAQQLESEGQTSEALKYYGIAAYVLGSDKDLAKIASLRVQSGQGPAASETAGAAPEAPPSASGLENRKQRVLQALKSASWNQQVEDSVLKDLAALTLAEAGDPVVAGLFEQVRNRLERQAEREVGRKDYARALEVLDRLSQHFPGQKSRWSNRISSIRALQVGNGKNPASASDSVAAAPGTALQPRLREAYRRGNLQEAKKLLAALERTGSLQGEDLFYKAWVLNGEGKSREATAALLQSLQQRPGFAPSLYLLGKIEAESGIKGKAVEHLTGALSSGSLNADQVKESRKLLADIQPSFPAKHLHKEKGWLSLGRGGDFCTGNLIFSRPGLRYLSSTESRHSRTLVLAVIDSIEVLPKQGLVVHLSLGSTYTFELDNSKVIEEVKTLLVQLYGFHSRPSQTGFLLKKSKN